MFEFEWIEFLAKCFVCRNLTKSKYTILYDVALIYNTVMQMVMQRIIALDLELRECSRIVLPSCSIVGL